MERHSVNGTNRPFGIEDGGPGEYGELWYEERSTGMRVTGARVVFRPEHTTEALQAIARNYTGMIRAISRAEAERKGYSDSLDIGPVRDRGDDDDDDDDDYNDPEDFGKFRRPVL